MNFFDGDDGFGIGFNKTQTLGDFYIGFHRVTGESDDTAEFFGDLDGFRDAG